MTLVNGCTLPLELVASNKIAIDYTKHANHIQEVFPSHFLKLEIREFKRDRGELVEQLLRYNRSIQAPRDAIENIESLSQPETYAIVTGQQPGLFTGPLYTIYKAISTIILCQRLSDKKKTLVPVFWNASEDSDLSEINRVTIFKQNNPFTIPYPEESANVVFSHLQLDKDSSRKMLAAIDRVSVNSEFKAELLRKINKMIDLSTTIADFFSRLMTHTFGELGLIMIEPQTLRGLMTPIFQELIEKPVDCAKLLAHTNAFLKSLGYPAKIHKKSDSCNFFIIDDKGKRLPVTFEDKTQEFQVGTEHSSTGELLDLLSNNPKAFGANAIIRPITQDFVLPTFGYVAGPNEIAYLAQLPRIYEFFSLKMPIIFPRFGATIVETKIQKVLIKYKADVSEFRNPERLLKRLAGKKLEAIDSLRDEVLESMLNITDQAKTLDKTLVQPIQVAKARILKTIEALDNKFASKIKENDQVARQQVTKASSNLFPNGNLQERQINLFEYLMKYGPNFLQMILERFSQAEYGEHVVIKC